PCPTRHPASGTWSTCATQLNEPPACTDPAVRSKAPPPVNATSPVGNPLMSGALNPNATCEPAAPAADDVSWTITNTAPARSRRRCGFGDPLWIVGSRSLFIDALPSLVTTWSLDHMSGVRTSGAFGPSVQRTSSGQTLGWAWGRSPLMGAGDGWLARSVHRDLAVADLHNGWRMHRER